MKLTILGCGRYNVNSSITDNYNAVGNLVQTDTTNILLDFGRGCLQKLSELGLSLKDIDVVGLTHFHPDHTADLIATVQQYVVERKRGQTDHVVQFIGPPGMKEWVQRVLDFMYEPDLTLDLPVHEGEYLELTVGDVHITTALMHHVIPNIGFRLDLNANGVVPDGLHSLFYSGDTGMCDAVVGLGRAVDVMILECSDESGTQTEFHLNPELCAQLALDAGAKQLVLTHYGTKACEAELTKAIQTYYDNHSSAVSTPPKCIIAQEGLTVL